MKNATTKNRILARNKGLQTQVYYSAPTRANDRKRAGRFMEIVTMHGTRPVTLRLNGTGINAIKKVLAQAGEVTVCR